MEQGSTALFFMRGGETCSLLVKVQHVELAGAIHSTGWCFFFLFLFLLLDIVSLFAAHVCNTSASMNTEIYFFLVGVVLQSLEKVNIEHKMSIRFLR